jgi:hypothetical protein
MLLYVIAVFLVWVAVWRFVAVRTKQKEARLRVQQRARVRKLARLRAARTRQPDQSEDD